MSRELGVSGQFEVAAGEIAYSCVVYGTAGGLRPAAGLTTTKAHFVALLSKLAD